MNSEKCSWRQLTLAGLTHVMGSRGDSTLCHLSHLPAGQSRHFPKKHALPLEPVPSWLGHHCFPSILFAKPSHKSSQGGSRIGAIIFASVVGSTKSHMTMGKDMGQGK